MLKNYKKENEELKRKNRELSTKIDSLDYRLMQRDKAFDIERKENLIRKQREENIKTIIQKEESKKTPAVLILDKIKEVINPAKSK